MYNLKTMKFIDQVQIEVSAGKGGDGIISFRHEARVEKGGPDGGDGGHGGNVYFQGDTGLNTLLPFHMLKHIRGHDGQNGKSKNMFGAKGEDVVVKVPLGTLVYEGQNLLCDVTSEDKYLICKGGIGGHGNARFKSSRNTVPRICENGTLGERKHLTLELKVMADLGLVGKPCAGKSTLLKVLSNAKPKISDYDFTTLVPQLGLVKTYENHSFVIADLPGLIAGASQGKGLGIQFLKHIERCKVIAFVLDFGDPEKDPVADFKMLQTELQAYNLQLQKRTFLIVANKQDLPDFKTNLAKFQKTLKQYAIVAVSALAKTNLEQLKAKMYHLVSQTTNISFEPEIKEVFVELPEDFVINKLYEGMYEVSGQTIEAIYHKNPLNTYENILRFNKQIKDLGLWQALIDAGIKPGDTVRIQGYQFSWEAD